MWHASHHVHLIPTVYIGTINPHSLVRALSTAGMRESQALIYTQEFFQHFDICNTGKLPLNMFIAEFQRMSLYKSLVALR